RYQADFFNGLEPGIRPLGPLLREKLSKHLVSTELYIGNWDDIGTPARLTALNERLA
ncbi:MAG: nucleotidyltransferase family protein, partial [Pseudoalteromonas marina]